MTYEVIHERLKRIRSIWVLDATNGYSVIALDENGDYIYDPE